MDNDAATTTAADTAYTMVDRGTVTIAGSVFTVEEQRYHSTGGNTVWLTGARGATYFLRPFIERKGDSGLRQVISWRSGAPLRRQGNEVQVVEIAGQIEQYKAARA